MLFFVFILFGVFRNRVLPELKGKQLWEEETVELGELRKLTRCAVEELPEPERSIFQRHYFLYQKTDEIAEALQLNSATVRTKLTRGREKLRRTLLEGGYRCEG